MEVLLGLGAVFLILATIFMPWINRHRVLSMSKEIDGLKKYVHQLSLELAEKNDTKPPPIASPLCQGSCRLD